MARIRTEQDSRDFQAPDRAVEAEDHGPGFVDSGPQQIDSVLDMDEATALAFNEEELLIIIQPSGEKNPEDPVEVSVNGRRCFIWRGKPTICKRKYVERLLRAQTNSVQQDITQREERDFNRLTITPTQRYPVIVRKDPSKFADQWLQSVCLAG